MDAALYQLLRETKLDDHALMQGGRGDNYTHKTMFSPQGKWTINPSKMSEFWLGYCSIVYEGKGNYGLAERSCDTMPLIVDCSLTFHADPQQTPGRAHADLYNEDFILAMVYCYQQAIIELLQIRDGKTDLICVVMESEKQWMTDDLLITQIRLQFPYCKTEVSYQTRVIRERAIQLLRQNNVIGRTRSTPIHDWSQNIDPIGTAEPVLMYKSTAVPDRPKLIVNRLYAHVTKEHIDAGTGPMLELATVFTPANHTYVNQGIIDEHIFDNDYDLEMWLPLFLSVHYWGCVTLPKNTPREMGIKLISPTVKLPTPPMERASEETPLEMACRFLPMLSRERVENDCYWLDVGKALYTCDDGGEFGLTEWIRFTEKSDTHSEEECRQIYPGFRDNNLTIQTIAWYAREDSPDSYREWHMQWCLPSMEQALSGLHSDVSQCLYRVYWLEFKCSAAEKRRFWQYKNHRWIKLDHGITLLKYMSDDFLKRFEAWRTGICRVIQENDDPAQKDSLEAKVKKITALIAKLKTVPFKSNIMKDVAVLFHDDKFEKCIDTNPDLLGMLDCVIEIGTDINGCGVATPRPGKPEDYITMCTGLPYMKDLYWNHPLVEKVMKWMRMVFVDAELREYFLKMSASCLKGKNSDKIFPIWTGSGNNSKSMVVKLFEATFGAYCIKFPTTTLTGKRTQSSGATPEVARSKGTRVAFAQEPDDEEVMKGGMIKEHTGGDRMYGRGLYQDGEEFEIMYKFFFMCNKIPPIPTGGDAVRNRTLIVPFLSTFKSDAPVVEEEQYATRTFPMDPFFERGIPEMAKAFMWILVQYYPRYIKEGLKIPKIVEEATKEYWSENDIYQHFISEMLIRATDEEGKPDITATIVHSDLFREFKNWFKESYPGAKTPDTTTAKAEFTRVLGPQRNRRWTGVRLVPHDNGANLFGL